MDFALFLITAGAAPIIYANLTLNHRTKRVLFDMPRITAWAFILGADELALGFLICNLSNFVLLRILINVL